MSRLVLNHSKNNIVFINDQGNGQFQIQTLQQKVGAENPILFKVITNVKQNVSLNPANGVLMSQGLKSKRSVKVKFAGTDIDMKKAKIQIRWLTMNSSAQLFPELESVIIFTEFYRKCSDKYKEQRIQMTLESCNQHNIQVVQYNLKIAKQSSIFKEYEQTSQPASYFLKNQEGDVFYHTYLQSKGFSEMTINILKKNNIKSLKQLKKVSLNGMKQAQIPLIDLMKLQQLIK